jgi:hypothetical protein
MVMKLPSPKSLNSKSTARTYPVETGTLARAVEETVRELPGWSLTDHSEREVRASRRGRVPGLADEVTVSLTPSTVGAHTNTWTEFRSSGGVPLWGLGRGRHNLNELLAGIDRRLRAE